MSEGAPPPRIEPYYRPDHDGVVRLYSGELTVTVNRVPHTCRGDLTLEIGPVPVVRARLADDGPQLFGNDVRVVDVPSAGVVPPAVPAVVTDDESAYRVGVDMVHVGSLETAARVLLHVTGALSGHFPHVKVDDQRVQPRVDFDLLGWRVAMVSVRASSDEVRQFSHVLEVRPVAHELVATDDSVHEILGALFHLLSFVAGQEVGATIAVAFNDVGEPVWTAWGSPRQRDGQHPGARWCSSNQVAEAIPVLAAGFTALANDDALDQVVPRAIGFLHAGVRGEVMDVRMPVVAIGLELLAWAVLQRRRLATEADLKKLPAGTAVRMMVETLDIPTGIPSNLKSLVKRADRLPRKDHVGPEVVFSVRNKLVHPPNHIDELEWPTKQEMIEAWQLAGWYLELGVLRLLGYDGLYWSRLRLGRGEWDVEPVPWAQERV